MARSSPDSSIGKLGAAARAAFRSQLLATAPSWYSPWAHLAIPSVLGLCALVVALAQVHVHELRAGQLAVVPLMIVISNAFEWRAHRGLLHRRNSALPGLEELYLRHTPEHHRIFVTEDMAIRSPREFRLVLIPAYGILLIFLGTFPVSLLLHFLGQHNMGALFLATCMGYAISYEWLHLSYHLPPDSFMGRRGLIRLLRRHHATHHNPELMQRWNFNVTLPLWDFLRGTIYRGPVQAEQAVPIKQAERRAS